MNSLGWQCPTCKEKRDPQFAECWNCGYVRTFDATETLPEPTPGADPMACAQCDIQLAYVATSNFPEGLRPARLLLGEFDELFTRRGRFDLYVCPRCGRVEMFVDGLGGEFRDH